MVVQQATHVEAGLRLTAGAVARRLGVAVTTLRTWDRRYRLGPSDRSPGKHRRYTGTDVARLELMRWLTAQGVPAADAARTALTAAPTGPAPEPAAVDVSADGLAFAAFSMDTALVAATLRQGLLRDGVVPTWDDVVVPVLVEVGRRWTDSRTGVDVEHLLSWQLSSLLRSVPAGGYGVLGTDGHRRAPSVLLAAAPHEQHTLPLEALEAALRERGVLSWTLGAQVPADALLAAATRLTPAQVVVWSHHPATADLAGLTALVDAVGGAAVSVAGPGWPAMALPSGVAHLSSLAEAVIHIRRTVPAPVTVGDR